MSDYKKVKYTPFDEGEEVELFTLKHYQDGYFYEPPTVRQRNAWTHDDYESGGHTAETAAGEEEELLDTVRTTEQVGSSLSKSGAKAVADLRKANYGTIKKGRNTSKGGKGRGLQKLVTWVGAGIAAAAGIGAVVHSQTKEEELNTSAYELAKSMEIGKNPHADNKGAKLPWEQTYGVKAYNDRVKSTDKQKQFEDNLQYIEKDKEWQYKNSKILQIESEKGLKWDGRQYQIDPNYIPPEDRPGYTLPGHKFIGPGNPIDTEVPVDEDDAIAKEHDEAYATAKNQKDIAIADEQAADKFLSDWQTNANTHSLLGGLGLIGKKHVEQTIGSIYPMGVLGRRTGESTPEKQPDSSSGPTPDKRPRTEDPAPGEATPSKPGTNPASPVTSDDPMQGGDDGGGGGGDSMAAALPGSGLNEPIWQGMPYRAEQVTLSFKKTYRLYINNDLPIKIAPANDPGHFHYYPGNFHEIPQQYLFFYLSTGEMTRLINCFEKVRIEHCGWQLTSLGTRIPFYTGATETTIANAGAQIPLAVYRGFDKDFVTLGSTEDRDALYTVLQGKAINSDGPYSAQLQPQPFVNKVLIRQIKENRIGGEPYLYPYASVYNGSTTYGPMIQGTHKPKNNIVYSYENSENIAYMQIDGLQRLVGSNMLRHPQDALQDYKDQGDLFNSVSPQEGGDLRDQNGVFTTTNSRDFKFALIENNHAHDPRDGIHKMQNVPRVCIGTMNVKNSDGSEIPTHWEIILESAITLRCQVGRTGWITQSGSKYGHRAPSNLHPTLSTGYVTQKLAGDPPTLQMTVHYDTDSRKDFRGLNNQPLCAQVPTAGFIIDDQPIAARLRSKNKDRI